MLCVYQQADAVRMHTDLKVGTYWGAMGVDFWSADMWKEQLQKYEVWYFVVILIEIMEILHV